MKEFKKDITAGTIPFKAIITIVVILCVGFIIFVWANSLTVECDPIDQVELTGLLRGYERNGSYWNVALDNISFLFGVWDQNYMRQFIGFDITISCCFRHDGFFDYCHYDMCCAYITEGDEP
ncbi:MAG: hypothetical protein KAW47_11090 [Thermoplasmatales archaeon]|nr:hypothetical protein [Thermoplasmatales archaeon]